MPPTRTRDLAKAGEGSVFADTESKSNEEASPKHWRRKKDPIPGVSKLKAAIRQTRRLLAKDILAADVRVETERRLKSLETDLAKAQVAKKERSLAVRYHRVKFFDRQKLTRKIKQTKKQLAADDLSRKARKSLESILFELRVDVNYVLNYPKTEKYISLFPPEVRHTPGAHPVHSATSEEKTITDARREELRDWIRGKMQAGELSAEPETLHADGESRRSTKDVKKSTGKTKAKEKDGAKGKQAREDADEDEDNDEDDSDESEDEDVEMQDVESESESEPESEPEPVQVKVKGNKKRDLALAQTNSKITKLSKQPSKTEKVAKPEKKAPKPEKKIARPEKKVAKSEKQTKPEKKVSTIEADDFFGSDSD